MNGCRSLVLWQRHSTTPPGPSLPRATRGCTRPEHSHQSQRGGGARVAPRAAAPEASSTKKCGRLWFRSRDRRRGSSGTRGSAPSWFSTPVEVSLPALAVEYISPAPAVSQASSLVVEYIAPVPAMLHAPTPVVEDYCTRASSVPSLASCETIAPAPAVVQAPTPAVEYFALLPVVFQAPTPAVEYIAPAPGVQAPTPVEENIAPEPGVQAPTLVEVTVGIRASSSSCASACGEVFFTRASSVPVASARCGVSFTRASFVRSASARWVFLTCASCASCWRSSRLCPRTEFHLSSWT